MSLPFALLQSVLTDPVTWLTGGTALSLISVGIAYGTLRTRVGATDRRMTDVERRQAQVIREIREDLRYLRARVDDLADGKR